MLEQALPLIRRGRRSAVRSFRFVPRNLKLCLDLLQWFSLRGDTRIKQRLSVTLYSTGLALLSLVFCPAVILAVDNHYWRMETGS